MLARAVLLVYETISPAKSFIKLVKFDILVESVGNFLFKSASSGCNSSDNLSATSIILSVNSSKATFNSNNNAVPSPIARGSNPTVATVAAPSAAVTPPIAIRIFVPVLIPDSIVSPLSKTGCQASPILSSCLAIALISVRNNPVATPSSTKIAVPSPIAIGKAYPVAVVATPSAAARAPTATSITVPVATAVLMVSPLSKTGCQASPTSSSSLPIAQISATKRIVAAPISNNMAVPMPTLAAIVLPFLPRALVSVPTVTRSAVPTPIAVATVSALSITGCQAIPTFSNSTPSNQIAPTIRTAAAVTSAIITNPKPRFVARLLSLFVSLDTPLDVLFMVSAASSISGVGFLCSVLNNLTAAIIPPTVVRTPVTMATTSSTSTPSANAPVIPLTTKDIPIPITMPPIAPFTPPNLKPKPAPINAPPTAPSMTDFQDNPSSKVTDILSISMPKPNAVVKALNAVENESENFQANRPVAILPINMRISPNLVSNKSAQLSISSVIPSHSFISFTICDTRLSVASPIKS